MPIPPIKRAAMKETAPRCQTRIPGPKCQRARQWKAAFFSAEPIRWPATQQGSQDSPVERRRQRQSMHARAEAPQGLDCLLRARNDDGVESEKETSQSGGNGPKQQLYFH